MCLLIALALLGETWSVSRCYCASASLCHHRAHAANSTLGFGKIYVVSRRDSPRRQSLQSAAALTNLDLTIPIQPAWSDADIASLRGSDNSALDRGSALAWLGHVNALKNFLADSEETALIMEDDADWDTRLRTRQIPQTAHAIRELLGSRVGYYGDTDLWDVIWLGHCGDYFNATSSSRIHAIKSWIDPTMPRLDELHPWTRDFMQEIGADRDQQRLVHESVQPLCTFAYAVTKRAAERLVTELAAGDSLRSLNRSRKAYDVRLLEGCRDEGLKCISVNPELFHHTELGSEIATVSHSRSAKDVGPTEEVLVESPTANIRCSARSRKWQEIRDSITDPLIDAEACVKELAEWSPRCETDGL